MACPKCGVISGDDWKQCYGRCPLDFSPHYDEKLKEDVENLKMIAKSLGKYVRDSDEYMYGLMESWNPVDNNSDAFSLMVHFGLPVNPAFNSGGLSVGFSSSQMIYKEDYNKTEEETRRCIVEACVERIKEGD